ncbi:MAG: hypothetical protein HXO75_08785 [Selenomonas artemidis]|nr:hypothetical protein [Selenomonas artemidis]
MGHGHTLSFLRNEMHMDEDLAATVRPIFFITVPMESRICNRVKNDFSPTIRSTMSSWEML